MKRITIGLLVALMLATTASPALAFTLGWVIKACFWWMEPCNIDCGWWCW